MDKAENRHNPARIGIMRVVDGRWKQAWYFGDELGLLLQPGFVDTLQV